MANAWSSQHIVNARASYNNYRYQAQKSTKLALYLSRYNSNTLRLSAYNQTYTMVAFPEGPRTRIRSIYLTLTGNINIMYYVYLSASSFFISTVAPTHTFSTLQVNKTYNAILVGWLTFSAPNTINDWNVYCYNHEPQRVYSTAAATTATISVPGFLTPPGKTSSLSRSGSSWAYGGCYFTHGPYYVGIGRTTASGTDALRYEYKCKCTTYCCGGYKISYGVRICQGWCQICSWCEGYYYCNWSVDLEAYWSTGSATIQPGIINSVSLLHHLRAGWWGGVNGTIYLTRQAA